MCLFRKALESGLECENIKNYVKFIGKRKIEDIISEMKNDYKTADQNQKELIEYRLNDIINKISNYSIISIFTGILIALLFIFKFDLKVTVVILIIMYVIFLYVISLILKYHRCCKMYLMVIENVKKNKMEEPTKEELNKEEPNK